MKHIPLIPTGGPDLCALRRCRAGITTALIKSHCLPCMTMTQATDPQTPTLPLKNGTPARDPIDAARPGKAKFTNDWTHEPSTCNGRSKCLSQRWQQRLDASSKAACRAQLGHQSSPDQAEQRKRWVSAARPRPMRSRKISCCKSKEIRGEQPQCRLGK